MHLCIFPMIQCLLWHHAASRVPHRISRTQCASSHSSFSYTIQRNGRAHDRRNTTSQGTLAHPFQPLLTFCVCSPVVVSFGYSIYTKKIHPALIGLKPRTMIPCRGEAVTWSFISSVIIWANLFMSAGNYSDNATSVNNGWSYPPHIIRYVWLGYSFHFRNQNKI